MIEIMWGLYDSKPRPAVQVTRENARAVCQYVGGEFQPDTDIFKVRVGKPNRQGYSKIWFVSESDWIVRETMDGVEVFRVYSDKIFKKIFHEISIEGTSLDRGGL